jgi:hypothetical protein
MKFLGKAFVLLVFSLLFPLVFLPFGFFVRQWRDPMRLRKGGRDSYLRLFPHSEQKRRLRDTSTKAVRFRQNLNPDLTPKP